MSQPANEVQVREQIEALRHMTTDQLKAEYLEVFGEETRSNHKQFLFRRIAWRIQANAWGGLPERAKQRALEIANDADLRIRAPRDFLKDAPVEERCLNTRIDAAHDERLPPPGTFLVRRYRGKDILVRVRDNGFEHDGRMFKSLSAAVTAATGTRWNGFSFFDLGHRPSSGLK